MRILRSAKFMLPMVALFLAVVTMGFGAGACAAENDYGFLCETLQAAAQRHDLPISFLTRLIWQESRFNAHAVSPAGAQGIGQFMPQTAAYLGLADPFDVRDAVDKSAQFLGELKKQFGNLGLASAAYNSGPRRVREWLAGAGLPAETQAYVRLVTGHSADEWRLAKPGDESLMPPDEVACPQLVKRLLSRPEPNSPPPDPTPAQSRENVWGLQLAGGPSRAAALAGYFAMQKSFQSVLGGRPPLILQSRSGRGHFWYRARVAVDSLFRAEALCSRLRHVGGSCVVQRNDKSS